MFISGMLKKAASGVLALLPCSRTRVRSARQKGCGLAGRTFLNIPCLLQISLLCKERLGEVESWYHRQAMRVVAIEHSEEPNLPSPLLTKEGKSRMSEEPLISSSHSCPSSYSSSHSYPCFPCPSCPSEPVPF